ncbi:MAG: hypothetical protein MUF53_08660, partial [Gemmatimonadaceae bacterium]|nr:hypothetical protein [Gemmatimonadaceae bacterium]
APIDALLEVEEWVGAWWEPSSVPLTSVAVAPRATDDELDVRGIPSTDRGRDDERLSQQDIEALIQSRDPEHPADLEWHPLPDASPPRVYPGNTRFKRRTPIEPGAVSPDERSSHAEAAPRRRGPDQPGARATRTGAPPRPRPRRDTPP